MKTNLRLGSHVKVKDQLGVIRFFGTTQFAEGEWVGIELDSGEGRNDGSVNGVRYFSCSREVQSGIFVRPALVEPIDSKTPSGGKGRSDVEAVVERLQLKLRKALEDVEFHKVKAKDLSSVLSQKETMISSLEARLETSSVDAEYLTAQNETLQSSLEELKSAFEELKEEYELAAEELSINRQLEDEFLSSGASEFDQSEITTILRQSRILKDANEKLNLERIENISRIGSAEAKIESISRDFESLKLSHDSTLQKLAEAERTIGDLQQQLDSISGSADLIDHLTSQNATLQDKVDDLSSAIEELSELRELDKALLAENSISEIRLKGQILDLERSLSAHETSINALNSNNLKLKNELEAYVSSTTRETNSSIVEAEREYLKAVLSATKSERAKMVNRLAPPPLKRQIVLHTRLSDLYAECEVACSALTHGPLDAIRKELNLSTISSSITFYNILLEFNTMDNATLKNIELQVEAFEEYTYQRDPSILGKPLEEAALSLDALDLQGQFRMCNSASQTRMFLTLHAEVRYLTRILRYLEAKMMRRLPEELVRIHDLAQECYSSIEKPLRQLKKHRGKDIEFLHALPTRLMKQLPASVGQFDNAIREMMPGDSEDTLPLSQESMIEMCEKLKEDSIHVAESLRELHSALFQIELSFSKDHVPNIFESLTRVHSTRSNNIPPQSKDENVHELELHLKLLEESLSSTKEHSAATSKALNEDRMRLEEELSVLKEKYSTLIEDNRALEQQVLEYLNVEMLTSAGQQTTHFQDLASRKMQTTEISLSEEISFLRKMLANDKYRPDTLKDSDLDWLAKPLSMSQPRSRLPAILKRSRDRRAYAVHMSNAIINANARKHQFVYQRYRPS